MKSPRPLILSLCLLLLGTATGCRTGGLGDLSKREILPSRTTWKAEELLSRHNANARKVQSLEAFPSITVNKQFVAGLSGKLALERPRNFNLTLDSTMAGKVANIGSNDQEFWFWIKDSEPRAVFYCNYDESGQSPLASSLQPDWIVESLGLQEITSESLVEAQVKPGAEPGTLVVSQNSVATTGPAFYKETVVSESTRRILEQRIYSADKKTLLARATVSDHQRVELPSPAGETPSAVELPKKLRLEWTQEKLILEVVLGKVKVNPVFAEGRRAALFAKPLIEGYAEVNLAEREGLAVYEAETGGSRTTIRRSLPAPPPRVKLAEPGPISARDPVAPPSRDPRPEIAALQPNRVAIEPVIGPRIPTVAEPSRAYIQANPGWKTGYGQPMER